MKNLEKAIFALTVIGIIILNSCKKEDTPTATLTIMEPVVADTVLQGDSVHMEGTILGTGELHGYTLELTNLTSGQLVYSGSTDNHQNAYAFHEHWPNNVATTSNMRLTLTVMLDHEGHSTSKTVDFVAAQ